MVILGLGSNLNNKESYLRQAIDLLSINVLSNIVLSPCYTSPALLPDNAPQDWDMPFLNMAIAGTTEFSPEALLSAIKQIEQTLGRQTRPVWAPREIDIDILAYDQLVLDTAQIQIPHKSLHLRPFAIFPLADIAPDWIHPVLHQTAKALAEILIPADHGATFRTDTIL